MENRFWSSTMPTATECGNRFSLHGSPGNNSKWAYCRVGTIIYKFVIIFFFLLYRKENDNRFVSSVVGGLWRTSVGSTAVEDCTYRNVIFHSYSYSPFKNKTTYSRLSTVFGIRLFVNSLSDLYIIYTIQNHNICIFDLQLKCN